MSTLHLHLIDTLHQKRMEAEDRVKTIESVRERGAKKGGSLSSCLSKSRELVNEG